MNKKEAIALLHSEGWTKADAQRALASLDFKAKTNINELTVRRAASKFAGAELLHRQRLQAAQKTQVTKKKNEIQKYIAQIEELKAFKGGNNIKQLKELQEKIKKLEKANDILKKDNKAMKDIVDQIKLKLTIEIKHLLDFKDSQIKKGLVKLLDSTLG